MKRYIRKVQSLALWKDGKESKVIPSTQHAMHYMADIAKGRGAPSLWLSEDEETSERIALGMLLLTEKAKIDNIRIIAIEEDCFSNTEASLINKEDDKFPIITVRHLHYELNPANAKVVHPVVENFLSCRGACQEFNKTKTNGTILSMSQILRKYIDEVSNDYKEKALKLLG